MQLLHYQSGEEIRLGDIVRFGHNETLTGRVVVIIPASQAAKGFIASDWHYLGTGIMIATQAIGLVHEASPDQDLILIQRTLKKD